ncbi:hypothetical protein JQC72_14760 [Polycladomyces sp. WAk]|uniref:Uncharacterized protein n=1 Tax=Polycladomyces zharkentensis TaxID=2807616 RepID=A0ABS2WML1_9BACL|nr:hypothetical protein [Polycladomyces sp. WAk]MBN2910759.1 hypothetical protein [Polycladomyces sp. WAk]
MYSLNGDWSAKTLHGAQFVCGYCGSVTASNQGFFNQIKNYHHTKYKHFIYICSFCNLPTFFEYFGTDCQKQTPAPMIGRTVKHLPKDVEKVYNEARDCTSVGAYTAAVMLCRKLLMHIAVEQGAEEGKSFKHYVDFW